MISGKSNDADNGSSGIGQSYSLGDSLHSRNVPRAAATIPHRSPLPRWIWPAAAVAALLFFVAVFASLGGPQDPFAGLAAALYAVLRAGAPAAAYLASGIGLGVLLAPLYRGARESFALQAGLGIALLLTLSHLLGWLGLIGGRGGFVIAAGVCGLGLLLFARQVAHWSQSGGTSVHISPLWAAAIPALALLLVAASNPPGWLWASEGNGYDALEYHLQLPQEWLAAGRIRPLPHNVYSYLPSYIESAFVHMAAMTGTPTTSTPGSPAAGLIAVDGLGVLSCQFLHAGIAALSAMFLSRLVAAVRRVKGDSSDDPTPGAAAGAIFLSIPWTIVTGSLPYNDLGVVLLMTASLIAALETGIPATRRGVLVGLLAGVACGCKPTAILFAAPPAGILLVGVLVGNHSKGTENGASGARGALPAVVAAVASASLAGLLTLSPWLIRNWIASGNPVFPAATSIFGTGHWTAEQISRFAASHRFEGSLLDRLRLIVLPDPGDPAARPDHPVHRGLLHPQWSIFFPLVLAAAATALASRRRRIAALLILGLAAQLIAWLLATHIQSRFALPMVVPGAALIGLALGVLADRGAAWSRIAAAVGAACALALATHAAIIFSSQGRDASGTPRPNAALIEGPTVFTGQDVRGRLAASTPAERTAFLQQQGPTPFSNLVLPPGSKLYLLGDSTPLYFTVPVVYTTTYDRSILASAIARAPGDSQVWAAELQRAGVTHILANLAELTRLEKSRFLDPDLRPEAIHRILSEQVIPIRRWPDLGVGLYELRSLSR
jgi:hypothetical protein